MSEAMTFAFIEAAAAQPFAPADRIVSVANPLSEKFAVLRPSLLPGLVDAAAHNRRREHKDVRLFEAGTRFSPSGESRAVAGVWCGAGVVPHWSGAAHEADFYDVKGVLETICRAFGVDPAFEPADVSYLVRGRSATVRVTADGAGLPGAGSAASGLSGNDVIGLVGQMAPAVAEARGFPANETLWAFEIDADALGSADTGDDLRAESLPRFPSIVRDLSVLVDAALPAASVRGTIRTAAPATLVHVIEFDRYRGKGVPEGRVSLSLRLTFRSPERTLTDAEVDAAMEAVVAALASVHGAVRR
jgi:phenylalanyl-tRNA synthetase beta chain